MATLEVQLSVNLTDLNGDSTPQQVYFTTSDATTLAQMTSDIQLYLGVLDLVTDAIIDKVIAKVQIPFTGLKSSPGPNAIGTGALVTYLVAGATADRSYGQQTPAFAQGKISNGQVNLSDSTVMDYINLWVSSGFTHLSALLSNNWVSLPKAERVKLNTRKHRREQQRINEEPIS